MNSESSHCASAHALSNRTSIRPRTPPGTRTRRPPPSHWKPRRSLAWTPRLSERHILCGGSRLKHRAIRASIQASTSKRSPGRPASVSGRHRDRKDEHPPNPRNTRQLQPPLWSNTQPTQPSMDSRWQHRRRGRPGRNARVNGRLWHGHWGQHPRASHVSGPLRLQAE